MVHLKYLLLVNVSYEGFSLIKYVSFYVNVDYSFFIKAINIPRKK